MELHKHRAGIGFRAGKRDGVGAEFLMLGGLVLPGRGRKKGARLGRAAGFCLGAFLTMMLTAPAVAANSTWNGTSSAWTDAANWIGGQPGGEVVEVGGSWVATGRSAVFSNAGVTTVDVVGSQTYDVAVDGITFDAGANAYVLNLNARTELTVTGGIINNSGTTQTFNTFTDFNASSKLKFLNDATAGNDTVFNMVGGVMRLGWGSNMEFWGYSSAAGATINQFGGEGYLANGGGTFFRESSSAGSSAINNFGTDVMGGGGGAVKFWDNATAGSSTITNYGGTMEGAGGGNVSFWDDASAGTSTLIALGGTDGGGGGVIEFIGNADASQATIRMYGNSTLEVSDAWDYYAPPRTGTIQVGSLEGEGTVYIGQRTLSVGNLNTSTTFAGAIVDPDPWEEQEFDGNLTKISTGTFTLTGVSTYSGKTTVNGGTLLIGTGGSIISAVTVNSAGAFGGNGTVMNSVTVNSDGNLAPGGEAITKISGAGLLKTGAKASFTLDGPGTPDGARLTTAGTDYGQVQLGSGLTIQSGVDLVIDATGLAVNSDFVVGEANVLSENYFIFNLTAAGSTLSQTGVFVTGAFASLNGQAISYANGFGLVSVGGQFYSISYQGDYATNSTIGGNDVVLSAIAVPEPGAFVLMLGGVGLLFILHRRGAIGGRQLKPSLGR